jgi:hypothetical protein
MDFREKSHTHVQECTYTLTLDFSWLQKHGRHIWFIITYLLLVIDNHFSILLNCSTVYNALVHTVSVHELYNTSLKCWATSLTIYMTTDKSDEFPRPNAPPPPPNMYHYFIFYYPVELQYMLLECWLLCKNHRVISGKNHHCSCNRVHYFLEKVLHGIFWT